MSDMDTRERLLDAASEIFSQKGYAQATVAEICERGGANIAAVNYHFGGKASLYCAIWPYAIELTRSTYPMFTENNALSSEDWLKQHIIIMINVTFDRGKAGRFIRLLQHELRSPTQEFESIHQQHVVPLMMFLYNKIGEILNTTDDRLIRCGLICVHSSYMSMVAVRPALNFLFGERAPDAEEVTTLGRQVFTYVLGGLHQLKEYE